MVILMSSRLSTKENRKKSESWSETFLSLMQFFLDVIICIYMLLIIVVMPFYNEEGFKHIGTDKADFLHKTIVYIGYVLLPVLLVDLIIHIYMYAKGKKKIQLADIRADFSVTDYCALTYGVAVVLSYLLTDYRDNALWGATGWFMGMVPQLALVVCYFLVSRSWNRREGLIALVFPVSAIVFALGILNRFGIFPIDMEVENILFISTIGNINWYCNYLISVFFVGFFLFWWVEWEKKWQKWLLTVYMIIGFATLVTNGSSSGILAMAVMYLVAFSLSAGDGKRMERFWHTMTIFSLTCTGIFLLRKTGILEITYMETTTELFTNCIFCIVMTIVSVGFLLWVRSCNSKGKYPQKLFIVLSRAISGIVIAAILLLIILIVVNTVTGGCIEKMTGMSQGGILTFSPGWGSNRGTTWKAGVMCFLEQNVLHKIVGAGPDCMSAFLYGAGSEGLVELVRTSFGNSTLTNAHNEWLTVLVNTGLLGFAGYVGMMVTAIKRYIGNRNQNDIPAACGFGLLAYNINNMFSFQQSMGVATIFIVLAVGENYMRKKKD